ncbi:undecaprenyl/decaprenyl-phosphate alpha-N-acetylglucosaminyl 1-phosphate transferase [Streptomyces rishiriensis]|uniref:UDP-GlcNAc:undecaprenyl-phosphate GlcNAc-1-phosphate transferase n=1 Tax=Streptomyces rishiriensis TaxID=68264 RepID=A0ABU0NUG2_STRRH|nr:undecaprenyl/decaprenyl-phosphate alpha-N-acetylglucosaminyl 1-phosphate transferase [Streptomyces rishiriensis]MDQ0582373.1 UDP-GlcNAc:undecaprenyl-phosphate GlcNAc-1-phosphate transferase [Streptomyces rishiriensis]
MLYGIVAAITALFLAAVLAALLRVPALRLGLLDRRQRQRRVPLFGGAAVVLATCLVAVAGDWTGIAPLGDGIEVLLAAGGAVAALGLVADVWRLNARFLVVGTATAAAFVVPYGDTGVVAGVASVGWITFVALAFRSLDHADGVAGTVGVVTAFGVAACAAVEVMDGLAVLLSVFAAALTGFLMHNWPPARVALGACGSLFAGFLLAAAAVTARAGHAPVAGAGVLFALTAVAVADVVLVVVSRRLARRPLLRGTSDHLAHRLRRLGLTAQGVTVLLGVAAFGAVLVGVLVHAGWADARAVWWVAGVVLVVVLGMLRVAVYGPPRARGRRDRRARGAQRAPAPRPAPRPGSGSASVYAPRRQSEGRRQSEDHAHHPESGVRRTGRSVSPQVNASLRVRNG